MSLSRLLAGLLGTAAAAVLMWLAGSSHLNRACILQDTPYLSLCAVPEPGSDEERQAKRERVRKDPGDSQAWVELTSVEVGPPQLAALRAATVLAPNEPNVVTWRATQALAQDDLKGATRLLVQIVRYSRIETAAKALAGIVASPQGPALLRPYLSSAGDWLPLVLQNLGTAELPASAALPLIAEAAAAGAVPTATVGSYISRLKAEQKWGDAYALWLSQQKGATRLLYNGGFDDSFGPDGFDWEPDPLPQSKSGAQVKQRPQTGRGQVLEIIFTGRSVTIPVIRQYLFLAPGKYVLRGEYATTRLRMEQGLAWVVRCTSEPARSAPPSRSAGLEETSGAWKSFQFEFVVPPQCGLVSSLQLETFAPFEAAAGFRGQASFDAFELQAVRM